MAGAATCSPLVCKAEAIWRSDFTFHTVTVTATTNAVPIWHVVTGVNKCA